MFSLISVPSTTLHLTTNSSKPDSLLGTKTLLVLVDVNVAEQETVIGVRVVNQQRVTAEIRRRDCLQVDIGIYRAAEGLSIHWSSVISGIQVLRIQ